MHAQHNAGLVGVSAMRWVGGCVCEQDVCRHLHVYGGENQNRYNLDVGSVRTRLGLKPTTTKAAVVGAMKRFGIDDSMCVGVCDVHFAGLLASLWNLVSSSLLHTDRCKTWQ